MKKLITKHFQAQLKLVSDMDATFIEIPFSVKDEFGTTGQVKAWIDGVLYRGSLANMGMGCHTLGITKKVRAEINKKPGDIVDVILEEDCEPRIIDLPNDLAIEFDRNEEIAHFFNSLSYTNRKEYVFG